MRKLGADTQEIADDVLDRHIASRGRLPVRGRLLAWPVFAAIYVVAFGFAWVTLVAAIYGVWRLIRWTLGWF